MKPILPLSSMCCLVISLAWADDAPSVGTSPPNGWTAQADGGYTHTLSGVICSKIIGTYAFVRLDGPSNPGILGTCIYSGGDVRVGEIRVRKFIDGVGDTPLAIRNDRGLMGLVPLDGAPPGARIVGGTRMGPGPTIDGTATSQYVMTNLRGGFLVDCISQTKQDKEEFEYAFSIFEKACAFSGQ